jgi:predicted MFS family arabinose efflux permease
MSTPETIAISNSADPAAAAPQKPTLRSWLSVFSLALGAAIIVTTEFIPVGFLPNVSQELGVSLGTAGLMVLVPGLSAAIAAPLVIVGAGRLDRRLLILMLGILVLLSNGLAAIAPSFAIVLVARIFLGIAIGGFWAVVPSLGFRLAGPQSGTRATSIILAGLSAGTVVGLPAGQFFGNLIGWRSTFAAAAGLALIIVVVQAVILPKIPAIGRMRFANLGRVFRVPIARTIMIAATVATIGQFAASTFVTPFLLQNVHMSTGSATLLFLGYGVAGIVGTLVGPVLVERGRMATFAGAAAAFGIALAVLPAVSGAPIVVSILIVAWGIIWGLVPLALQTHMLTATPDAPEASSSMLIAVMQLAIAIGSGVGGLLVDSAGLSVMFLISGLVAIGAAVFGFVARRGL